MKIFYVSGEATPFIKTGGLADVSGSLPQALVDKGQELCVAIPLYSQIQQKWRDQFEFIGYYYVDLGWRHQYCGVFTYFDGKVRYYFLDNEYYFKRSSIYGQPDDGERFIFFNKALAQLLRYLNYHPDIVHANDWHTGLLPLYIEDFRRGDEFYEGISSVYTIHNLKYQGIFPKSVLWDLAGLSDMYFNEDGLKYYDCINFMKAGIVYSDIFTTVSPSYSEEIKYSFFGETLEGIIRKHDYKLRGIINGIDYGIYNPETDKKIVKNYGIDRFSQKVENKREVQRRFGLEQRDDVFMVAMVTRLVAMKGIELVRVVIDELLREDIQFVLIGTGEREYEDMFKYFEYRYRGKCAARTYFDEAESHLVYAGADAFLMPSIAEPCGISQLIALRYGTIPIVRETGGLRDTVRPYNKYTGEGNGYSFSPINAHELLFTVKRAMHDYKNKEIWNGLIREAMESDNSWGKSSSEYIKAYEEARRWN